MEELVLRDDTSDGVAVLTLNRPKALNALNPDVFGQLKAHLDAIAAATETIGCIVLRGAGRAFSAGVDLKAMARGETEPTPIFSGETLDFLEAMPQPVIAAVRGPCYTGGLELALTSDLLLCSDTAKFADTHAKWGLVPGWGMTQRLPRRVGPIKAKEMMFTARPIGHEEAVRIGIANDWVPDADLDARTMEMATMIVGNVWSSLRADKALTRGGQDYTLSDGLAYERRAKPGRAPDAKQRLAQFNA
jgi:enoyl-CoA hydratase